MLADLRYRLRALFRRAEMDRELHDEVQFHIERETEKLVRAGVPRAEAERRAHLEFGGVEQIKEDTRSVRGVSRLDSLLQDVRYGWRGIRARPGFSFAVILTLGLGIGANTAMFGVVDRLLVRAPAYMTDAERVHRVHMKYTWDGALQTDRNFEYLHYHGVQQTANAFDVVAAYAYPTLAVGAGGEAREHIVAAVSASFFAFFALRPELGRFFTAQDDVLPTGQNVAVLEYGYWQSAYGGSESVLGQEIHVGKGVYTIIGVAPRGFVGVAESSTPVLFMPITAYAYARTPTYAQEYGWSWLEMMARRRPGVTIEAATADMSRALTHVWDVQYTTVTWRRPSSDAKPFANVVPVLSARGPDASADVKVATWVMGVAFIVLLIAAANVINLLLARALDRRREIALRLALGVTRGRLVQQLLTETLLLALLGGAAGLAFAQWGGGALRALFLRPEDVGAVASDGRTLLFTALLTLMIALLSGLAPALQASRADVANTLKAGMRQSAYRQSALRTGLLLFQGALCVVLLVGAGLFVRSLQNVRAVRLGYDVDPVLVVRTNPRSVVLNDAERNALSDRLQAAALTVPGVTNATLVVSVPFGGREGRGAPHVPGRDSLQLLGSYSLQAGSHSYFETMGTRIVRGRGFTAADVASSEPVVIVSEAMAQAIWPGTDAVGQQMRIGPDTMPFLHVVGVAEDIATRRIGGPPEFWYYLPIEQFKARYGSASGGLVVRVQGKAEDYAEALRHRLQAELPGDAYARTRPLAELVSPQQRSWQFGATMFAVFAGLALVLAVIGLYSVIAYAVAQRTREFGVRMALGASMPNVMGMVIGQGVLFAVIGIAVGSTVALFAARWVEPLLFSASAKDPVIYGAVALLLLVVALAATLRPAWRATRVDPTIALRAE